MKTKEEIRKASNLLILEEQEDGGTGIIFQGTKRYGMEEIQLEIAEVMKE